MNLSTTQLTNLRDGRKPGHFWMDNEVADCYQPIVGADAIWVYCRIARNAHGAWIVSPKRRDGDTRLALREIAEWCGKSVDTVWRCLQVLEHVGLLQGVHAVKGSGRYALADVKALVLQEGGEYDVRLGCFQLPAQRVAELKSEVRALRLKLARKKALGTEKPARVTAQSVALSDRLEGSLFSAPDEKCDRSVAQSDKTVALGVQPTNKQDCKTAKQTTPPYPPQAGEGAVETEKRDGASKTESSTAGVEGNGVSDALVLGGADAGKAMAADENLCEPGAGRDLCGLSAGSGQVDSQRERRSTPERDFELNAAVEQVMRGCGFTARRLRLKLRAVVVQRMDLGESSVEIAAAMVDAWMRYTKQGLRLRAHMNAAKFFEEGYWLNSNSWHWDTETLREERLAAEAGVGSVR